ncbi:hypothetical protein SASPL_101159 [Salvia splendens]|uniref:Uncharacterized protein n=1 Tax=Salvia splendens TaxID=180675 RepID=A0A8X9AC93_SALSN|nr:hypothetical protein SASPL_101159 [Salvia splendens]
MGGELHIMFLPLMAHGHMIPALDMAKLFTSRGLKTTIISTPSFSSPVLNAQAAGLDIGLDLLRQLNPNCLISDMFLPWTADSAAKFGIPRFVFHGTSYFSLCAAEELRRHKPFRGTDHFVLPNLPHREEMATTELEPDYADHYRNALGRMAWKIDPLLLCNNAGGAGERGKKPSVDVAACVAWLDSKKVNSVPRKTFTVDTKGGIKASQLLINAIEILKQKLGVVRLSADTVEADEQFGELGPHMRRG